jgi:hypothetical protein
MNELTIGNGLNLASYAANLDAQLKVCNLLVQSRLLPKALQSPAQVFAVVTMGAEYGFTPVRSCHLFDYINGTVAPRAAALQAIATSAGGSFKTIELTEEKAVILATRVRPGGSNWSEQVEYTIEDAKLAGLTGKDNWKKHPKDMLYARAVSRACRRGWQDVIGGLYSAEELEEPMNVTPAEAAKSDESQLIFRYDITAAPAEKRATIEAYLRSFGAIEEAGSDHVWLASERLKKMDNYYQPVAKAQAAPAVEVGSSKSSLERDVDDATASFAQSLMEVAKEKKRILEEGIKTLAEDTAEGESIAAEYERLKKEGAI